jgi:endonuclease/exonuclease/phosphatase family metal-dependent hydrolase
MPTVPKRNHAAKTLRTATDSIFRVNQNAHILITGDFNDGPEDESVSKILNALAPSEIKSPTDLYNLMLTKQEDWPFGSLKYQQGWDKFDMMIVSGSLLNENSKLYISEQKATIFHPEFLLENDKTYLGQKPNRTYIGFKYHGGFSDHLPVYVDVRLGGE